MLSKFIIRDYLKDMLIYLSLDSDTIRTSKLFQRSIENNWGKTFGLVWKKFYLKPEHELVVFNKAIIFRSYNVIERICKNKYKLNVGDASFSKAFCDILTSSHDWRARKIIEMLWKYDPSEYFLYHEHHFDEDMIEAATKSPDRWSLDFIHANDNIAFMRARERSDALLEHIRDNNVEMVEAMLYYHFDPHIYDDAAIPVAGRNCNYNIIEMLLDSGVDPSAHDWAGVRKIIINGNYRVLGLLEEKTGLVGFPEELKDRFTRKVAECAYAEKK